MLHLSYLDLRYQLNQFTIKHTREIHYKGKAAYTHTLNSSLLFGNI